MNIYLYQFIIAIGILTLHIILGIILLLRLTNKDSLVKKHLQQHGMFYALSIAIAGLVGSLGFSIVYNYPPCDLCWWQRIFHYPQILIFIVGIYYHDIRAWTYSLWLSVIGGIIGLYQVIIQRSPNIALPEVCATGPNAQSCSEVLVQSFGYITIPVMSLTFFVILIVLAMYQKKQS